MSTSVDRNPAPCYDAQAHVCMPSPMVPLLAGAGTLTAAPSSPLAPGAALPGDRQPAPGRDRIFERWPGRCNDTQPPLPAPPRAISLCGGLDTAGSSRLKDLRPPPSLSGQGKPAEGQRDIWPPDLLLEPFHRGDRHSGSKPGPSSLTLPAPLPRQPCGGRTELSSADSSHLQLLTL